MVTTRHQLDLHEIRIAMQHAVIHYENKLKEKGNGIFVSTHEISGLLGEEVAEFVSAVHDNNQNKARQELMDVMVVCLHGIASIDSGKMDW